MEWVNIVDLLMRVILFFLYKITELFSRLSQCTLPSDFLKVKLLTVFPLLKDHLAYPHLGSLCPARERLDISDGR